MIVKDDGDIESESSQEDISKNDRYSSDETTPFEGDLLMYKEKTSFTLNACLKEIVVHSLLMDVTVHVASLRLYKDEILCDVVPMEVTHILLGRPWQFNRKVTHNAVTKKFSFEHNGKKGNS
ncbi:hypothetical protein CR513_30103, partial [Mucuna pruriens]